jgi:DNA topoisomerase-1
LRILVEREREIQAFIPETYWAISGQWKTLTGATVTLTCSKEPRDKKEVDSILAKARAEKWQVVDVEETEVKRSPRAPFITSTLQQTASSRLGFSPSRTMGIAQKLYESGAITYMRTDSTNLGQQALDQIGAVVKKQYGEKYLLFRKYAAKSKNAQEAHEAIRPSHFDKLNAGANDEQKKLYRLIWQRAVASQMADANIMRTKIIANTEKDSVPNFDATGSRVLFDGWLKADPESTGEEVTLPKCAKDEALDLVAIDSLEKQTLPPPRYTEAGLIKELEKRGIGRPSTYASICKTIEDRGYVGKEGRSLKPTDTGEVVSSFLEEYFPTYISDTFTAEMEDKLDGIANGTHTYLKTLKDFYGPFHKEVKSKEKVAKATDLGVADAKFKCPKCGTTPTGIKLGRNGKFISCTRYPDCDGALTLDGHEFKKDEPIGVDPTTGLPIFVLNGRFGPYVQLGVKIPKEKKKRVKKVKVPKEAKVAGKKSKKVTAEVQALSTETKSDQNLVTLENENTPVTPAPVKPKMASIPRGTDPSTVTIKDALKYLSLPRNLGAHPTTGKDVVASAGRFGPYVVSDGNYRSIKAPDNVYDIDLKRALEMLAIEKKPRGFAKKKKAE